MNIRECNPMRQKEKKPYPPPAPHILYICIPLVPKYMINLKLQDRSHNNTLIDNLLVPKHVIPLVPKYMINFKLQDGSHNIMLINNLSVPKHVISPKLQDGSYNTNCSLRNNLFTHSNNTKSNE